MLSDWITCLLGGSCLMALALFARYRFGAWLFPGALFPLYWAVVLLVSALMAPDYFVWRGAVWYILIASLAISTGAMAGSSVGVTVGKRLFVRSFWSEGCMRDTIAIIIILCCAAWLTIPILAWSRENTFLDMFLAGDLHDLPYEYSVARYHRDYEIPLVAKCLNAGLFAAAILIGYLSTALKARLLWLLGVLFCIPLLFQALILTTRNMLLIPFFFATSGYMARIVVSNDGKRFCSARYLLFGILLVFIGACFFLLLQHMRDGCNESYLVSLKKLKSAVLGPPAVFSRWLKNYHDATPASLGSCTFAGLFDWFGLKERIGGLYPEFTYLGEASDQSETSNIHTVFRGLIEDFGIVGSFLFLFILGIFLGATFSRVSAGESHLVPILSMYYAWVLWGFIASITIYNSVLLSWLLLLAVFRFVLFRKRSHLCDPYCSTYRTSL